MAGKIQAQLWDIALDAHGYVTTNDARRLGIDGIELVKLAHRGQLDHAGHGIYRFPQLPTTQVAPYMLAVLWTGGRGVLSHATALELYELSEINPDRIHLTVPHHYRPRRRGGELYLIHHEDLEGEQIGRFEGIPIVEPAVAIAQAIDSGTAGYLVRQAVATARNRGEIGEREQELLEAKLAERP